MAARYFEAFTATDHETILSLFSDDVV